MGEAGAGVRAAPDAAPADWLGPRLMVWGTQEGTPVGAVVPADYAAYARIAAGPGAGHAGPSLWWPEDRAWCVATEIDFCWTYVAGSQACVDALLDHPGLEALPTQPSHRGDIDSDTINANG